MASKRRLRRNMCGSKMRFKTKPHASLAAIALNKKMNSSRIHAYLCPHCGHFHIGHH